MYQTLFTSVVLVLGIPLLPAAERPRRDAAPDRQEHAVEATTAAARPSIAVIKRFGRDGNEDGVGAGFVVGTDGLIATCLHVIDEARALVIELGDRRYDATEIFASDRKLDLAIIRVNATNLPALKLGDSESLEQGATVIAIGNPLGFAHSVVSGVVSAKRDRLGQEMIQLAIPVEPGNSGGPLLDSLGHVQGVLALKDRFTANIGFAIPVNALKSLLEKPNPVPIGRWLKVVSLNPEEWTPVMGARWRRKAGAIHVEEPGSGFGGRSLCLSHTAVPSLPYELAVTVKLEDESGAAGLAFASDGRDVHYGFYPTAGQMRLTRFDGPSVFTWNILAEVKTPFYRPGEWNTIKLRVETNRILCYVNGQQVIASPDTARRDGKVGLAKFRDTRAQFRNFRIAPVISDEKIPAEIVATLPARVSSNELNLDLLQRHPQAGRRVLLEQASALEREADRLRRVAAELHARSVESQLVATLNKPDEKIDLVAAALLVAKLDNPDLDGAPYRAEVARMAEEFQAKVKNVTDDAGKLAALTKFLFAENGFHGSRTDFYNPANSYLNDVIDDREGLPITLSILYLELARRAGISNVVGVPLPTRFMVRHAPSEGREQIIDVFDGGRLLTRTEAVELVADNVDAVSREHFEPATKREIVTRMLRNLLGLAERSGSREDMLRYLDVIIALSPDTAFDRLSRARVLMQLDENARAKRDLRWLLDNEVPGLDLERLAELYRSLE